MPRQKRQLVGSEFGLQQVIDALNHGPECGDRLMTPDAHERLLRAVRLWIESGHDLFKMNRHPGDPTWQEMSKSYEGILSPQPNGRARMVPVPSAIADGAGLYFIQLVTNPVCDSLRLPCPQCGNWFIGKTARKGRFCSQTCSRRRKLVLKRDREHQRKIERCIESMAKYPTRRKRDQGLTWKEYVSADVLGVSINFLTHAIKTGRLKEPA